jgi:DNA-binding MarR family transcriptional regulator
MPKLTDSQLVILSAAASHDDHALLPFPKSLKLNKGALTAVINSLIKNGLVREQRVERDQMPWRQTDHIFLTNFIVMRRRTRAEHSCNCG